VTDSQHVISAFTAEHVVKLAGLTLTQLAYWDRTGFFCPQYAAENRRSPYARLYSFKDVVGLRTISLLKGKYGVSLPHLREVAQRLSAYSAAPWADIRLKVWNRKVQFDDPETGRTVGVVDGQFVLLPIIDVIDEVRHEAEKLRHRQKDQIGQIEKHRYIAHNSPVVAGTRVRVSAIIHFIEAGYSPAQIVKEYPSLTEADVEAAVAHAKSGVAA
jgi:uncharacterized protein (DUF433 family)